jgi:hypothetical protein
MPHPGRVRDFADHHANAMEKVLDASNGVEVLVLAGSSEGGEVFEMQSWLRLPKDSITLATVGINGAGLDQTRPPCRDTATTLARADEVIYGSLS